jgi:hypothetical protein
VYYFARQDLFDSRNIIEVVGHTPVTAEFQWIAGVKFDRPVPHETIELDASYGTDVPDFFDTSIPLMSRRLIDTLSAVGVNNLDVYPMTLRRQDTGEQLDGFSAVNVVGCVDAINLEASEHTTRRGRPYFTGKIVLDDTRAGDFDVFRLPRGPGFIVVTERIARVLNEGGFKALLVQPTVDYSGS